MASMYAAMSSRSVTLASAAAVLIGAVAVFAVLGQSLLFFLVTGVVVSRARLA